MNDSVTIQEQMHRFWRIAAYVSGVLCLIFFTVFWNLSVPLWSGIFRLCAFIFFALTVLGFLKLMNGPLTATLKSSNDHLLILYKKKGETIQEEQFERSTIKEVTLSQSGQNFISSYLLPNSRAVKINFTDTDRELHFFEFGGRPLFFDQPALLEIQAFLKEKGIAITGKQPKR